MIRECTVYIIKKISKEVQIRHIPRISSASFKDVGLFLFKKKMFVLFVK